MSKDYGDVVTSNVSKIATSTANKVTSLSSSVTEPLADHQNKKDGRSACIPISNGNIMLARVLVKEKNAEIIQTLTAEQICSMTDKCNNRSQLSAGLTRVELIKLPSFEMNSVAKESSNKSKVCFYIMPFTIDLSFAWIKIWLASELELNTCPYESILSHEKMHVSLAKAVLQKYSKGLETSLSQAGIPTSNNSIAISNNPSAFQQANAKYNKMIKYIVEREYIKKLQKIYDEIGKAWNNFDTDEEYARVRQSCPESSWPY